MAGKLFGEQEIQRIVSLLRERTGACLILLFGSQAQNRARMDSDVDIAFAGEKKLDPYGVFLLGQELAALLGCEVDLVDLAQASTVMRAQIVSAGRILFCADETKRQRLYLQIYREYASFNERRGEILKAVLERGSVYAG